MLRGVSKQIIEINETGNKYFDRAVLYVSSDYIGSPNDRLTAEAQRLVSVMDEPPASAARKKRRVLLLKGLLITSYPVLALIVYLIARG